jgi:hypothetical protein
MAVGNKSSGVPMPGIDKPTGRVVALTVLVVLAAAALRGYLPGGERAPREQPTSNPATLIAVVALLSASIVIIAIAILTSAREPRMAADTIGDLPEGLRGRRGRLGWRFLLIGLGAILVWLLIIVLLARLGAPHGLDQPAAGTGSSTAPRSTDTPPPSPSPPPSPAPPDAGGNMFGYLAATTVILLLLLAAGTVVAARRQRRIAKPSVLADDGSAPPTSTAGSDSLARAAELGLAEIGDLSREPREAIIACYAAMERGLARAPGAVPLDSDTPSEVLARAVEHRALQANTATELVDLFTEARFSSHVMNEGHREVAVRVLRLVLDELRSVA